MTEATAPTYARAGGPPDNWQELTIWDRATGLEVEWVVEVNAAEGWAIVYETPGRDDPETNTLARKRISGDFEIRLTPEPN